MKIAIVTAGHLSTCPRMLKAADALAEEGHDVHVVSTRATPWATEADVSVRERRAGKWRWSVVDYGRSGAPLTYVLSGAKQKWSNQMARWRPTIPFPMAAKAICRVYDELVRAALETGADFFYGGTVGGIGVSFEAARRAGREYALDLEDFYSGNEADDFVSALVECVEAHVVEGARFLTAASAGIADAYRTKYGVAPTVVHNVFPLPREAPGTTPSPDTLKLYWFSQTIGCGRGLEDVVEAIRRGDVAAELHLRGSADAAFLARLRSRASGNGSKLRLAVRPPAPPDDMIGLLEGYDVGLATEQAGSVNREICLTNKALTYVLGGLALVMTETAGHRPLIEELGDSCIHYAPGDVDRLASGLKRLAADRGFLERCRRASWEAARRRWHWEHASERGRLIELVAALA